MISLIYYHDQQTARNMVKPVFHPTFSSPVSTKATVPPVPSAPVPAPAAFHGNIPDLHHLAAMVCLDEAASCQYETANVLKNGSSNLQILEL